MIKTERATASWRPAKGTYGVTPGRRVVSVAMPVRNGAPYLHTAICRIVNQTEARRNSTESRPNEPEAPMALRSVPISHQLTGQGR